MFDLWTIYNHRMLHSLFLYVKCIYCILRVYCRKLGAYIGSWKCKFFWQRLKAACYLMIMQSQNRRHDYRKLADYGYILLTVKHSLCVQCKLFLTKQVYTIDDVYLMCNCLSFMQTVAVIWAILGFSICLIFNGYIGSRLVIGHYTLHIIWAWNDLCRWRMRHTRCSNNAF